MYYILERKSVKMQIVRAGNLACNCAGQSKCRKVLMSIKTEKEEKSILQKQLMQRSV